MNIILEGPDNAGKTTFAETIRKYCGSVVNYYHPGGRPADENHEIGFMENQYKFLQKQQGIMMDRCTPISQQVYNPDERLDRIRADWLTKFLATGVVIVYFRPSTDRLMRVQDFTWRPGESEDHKQKIIQNQHTFIQRYDKLMQIVPHVTYDFEDSSSELVVSKVIGGFMDDPRDMFWLQDIMRGVKT